MNDKTHPLQLLGLLVIDYFRWTQLVPMITMWLFALLMVFLLYFVNHQEETIGGVGAVAAWVAELPVVGPAYLEWMEEQAGSDDTLHFGGGDFENAAMKLWAILSFVFMLLGWLVASLFGPFEPWTLKRKIGLTALGCMGLLAGFLGVYFHSPDTFNGSLSQWALNFSGIALLIFLVSAWCLTVAHVLGLLKGTLTIAGKSQATH